MEKRNKILILTLVTAFLLVILVGYYNFFIRGNYEVTKQVYCNPKVESCFVSDCESNDPSCDQTTTYKKISVLSKYAGSDYNSLSCVANSTICKIITCQNYTIEAGEKCFK